jgi:hypothetical protein
MSAPTPRTDALVGELYGMASPLAMPKITMIEHARQLESELSTANNAYSGVERVNLELQRELAEANAELERRQAKIMRLSARPEVFARWIPVGDGLPKSGENVLAFVDRGDGWTRRIRAFRADQHTVEADDDSIEYELAEYVESEDQYYLPAGWFEQNEYDEHFWSVSDPVTHWMPLPSPPDMNNGEGSK